MLLIDATHPNPEPYTLPQHHAWEEFPTISLVRFSGFAQSV
jgi:hypothetical protein